MKKFGIMFAVLSSVLAMGCVSEVDPSDPQAADQEKVGEATQAVLPDCDSVDGTLCHTQGQTRSCAIGFVKETCVCTSNINGFWSCP